MDFLECPDCRERYVVADDEGSEAWICSRCGADLRLVAWHMPGRQEELVDALHAAPTRPEKREGGP